MGKAACRFHPAPALITGGVSLLLVLAACSPVPAPATTATPPGGLPGGTPVEAVPPQATTFILTLTSVDQRAALGDHPAEPLYASAATLQEWEALSGRLPAAAFAAGKEAIQGQDVLLLVAFAGVRGSSGYTVEIQEVRPEGEQWIVVVAETQPAPGAIVEPARTLPYHIASLSLSALPAGSPVKIVFQDPQGNLLGRHGLRQPAP